MRDIIITRQFKTDRKSILQKQDLEALKKVLGYLVDGKKLPDEYKEHHLIGKYNQHLECHIKPDLLLIYKIEGNTLTLYRIGTHAKLFK